MGNDMGFIYIYCDLILVLVAVTVMISIVKFWDVVERLHIISWARAATASETQVMIACTTRGWPLTIWGK